MKELTQEQKLVASIFSQNFRKDRKRPLTLYGLGRNTEAILQMCPEVEIVGVMGPDADGPIWNGKRVLSNEEAISLGTDIVIVAREAVVPLIYRRISALEAQNVQIFRIDGSKLSGNTRRWCGEGLPYWRLTKEELKRRIDCVDYVSFDIFDTLLGRRLLHPWDLYKEVERQAMDRSWPAEYFAETRRESERALGSVAGIQMIYDRVQKVLGLSPSVTMELMKLEWELEQKTDFLRQDMGELFRYAEGRSKRVTLISDMFWPAERLRQLLAGQGLRTDALILVSCEMNYAKENGGLYAAYLDRTGGRPSACLHIGDNHYADIEAARLTGLQTCQVLSGYQMLEESAAQGLLDCTGHSEDARTVGKWIGRQCSSPFGLQENTGRFKVETPYELGYDFLGPLVDFWIGWLQEQLRGGELRRMLFPARDGYLPQKIYELLRSSAPELPPSVYFKASRRVVSVASLRTEEDVYAVSERKFHGSTREFFLRRFGVEVMDETPWEERTQTARDILERTVPLILEHAEEERSCYLAYLAGLGLPGEGKSGFFDFVAGGTVQKFYQRLTGSQTEGFYFATLNLPNRFYTPEDIAAPFGNFTSYACPSPLSEHYLMLENVLTDPDTMLIRVDRDGQMIYADGQNMAWPITEQVQQGIFDYVRERLRRGEPPAGKEAALGIFELLFDGSTVVPRQLRERFIYEDMYNGTPPEPCWS